MCQDKLLHQQTSENGIFTSTLIVGWISLREHVSNRKQPITTAYIFATVSISAIWVIEVL